MHLELSDGVIIKSDAILELDPRLRRIRFVTGAQRNVTPEDIDKLKTALLGEKPKQSKRVPSKRVSTKEKAPTKE